MKGRRERERERELEIEQIYMSNACSTMTDQLRGVLMFQIQNKVKQE